MCGIAGIVTSSNNIDIEKTATIMAEEILSRGPDSAGLFSFNFKKNNIAISHRRLSILDLSPQGNQPMKSKNKRFVLAFNGEIYNHKFLKRKIDNIKDIKWSGNSDTEILVESIAIFGIKKTLELAVGMFSIVLLDNQEEKLYLLRDRLGEKPLYYGFIGDSNNKSLVFASEINAISKLPFFKKELNALSFEYFLRLSYIPKPLSIYKDIFKIKPASMIIFNLKDNLNQKPKEIDWWSYINIASKNIDNKFDDEEEALKQIEKNLDLSIKEQSISDVPLGCFLSGGIDSTIIAAKLQSQNKHRIKTFTIGFNDKEFDESKYAKKIANFIGTDHKEFIISPNEIFNIINELPKIYTEPFADSSQIPTALICKEIKKAGITVALSGDGGDEIFGGYVRHYMIDNIWSKINLLPFNIRKTIGINLSKLPSQYWNNINLFKRQNLGQKIIKLNQSLINSQSRESFYKSLVIDSNLDDLYSDEFKELIGMNKFKNNFNIFPLIENKKIDFIDKILIWDALLYLTDDILVKIDRASMHYSLETRAPFLDKRLVELATRIPSNMKVKKNYGKHILRKLVYKYIPKEYVERPKSGFAIPLGQWLRKDLKSWAEEFIYYEDDFINQKRLVKIWNQHQNYICDHKIILWRIIMWRAWLIENNL